MHLILDRKEIGEYPQFERSRPDNDNGPDVELRIGPEVPLSYHHPRRDV